MSLEKQQHDRIFGLDVVRAIAILLVLFSHVHYLIDSTNPTIISLSGLIGFAGVELFFVLSGFLIGTILLKMYVSEDFSKERIFIFFKRRWFRTLPNYFLVLLLNVILALIFNYDLTAIWRSFLFLQNFNQYNIVIFTESWSLSVEEWTYIITPIVLYFSYKLFQKNKKLGFLITTLFLILICHWHRFIYSEHHTIYDMETWNTSIKSLVIYRLDAIIIGFIVAWIHFFYTQTLKKYSVYLFIISLHLFFLQFFVLNVLGVQIISNPVYFLVFYFTLSSVTFALGLPVFIYWKQSKSIFVKPITFISKVSYSVYLLHYSLIAVMLKYAITLSEIQLPSIVIVAVYVVLTFSLSYLLYRFYELPMMQLREKR